MTFICNAGISITQNFEVPVVQKSGPNKFSKQMRQSQDKTVSLFYLRDETKTRLDSKFELRPRQDWESLCLFLRDRDENHLLMKKMIEHWLNFLFKPTHPDQDETRLSKIQANKTRPRQDCLKHFQPRQDYFQNFVRDWDKTETRPKLSSFNVLNQI